MKNMIKNNYIYEDDNANSDIESIITNNFEDSMNKCKSEPEQCPIEGFNLNEIAEAIATAAEYRKFIRNKGK